MATVEQRLTDMLTPAVEALGFELLGIEYVSAGKHSIVRLFIDHENGINVDNCADVSRQASAILDVEDPISTEYNLEVSSPGLERPLFKAEHYLRFIGEIAFVQVRMPVNNRRKWQGEIIAVEDDTVVLAVDKEQHRIALGNVQKAHLVPQFD
ncbi:ribosome maturation factor RimP [Agarivorans aestuarii]|uniref:Ribosome maturation factor RimP n=1 Tax=Agarivorans aestuarii TaxID=1563703 RepID=A0ABU7G3T4_9ALTE|nr:ribosome maturation factor RimP [Agarivorans aestuarii]MEE1674069.1 ribosome maturation factor RimP [Agarivorans aestuarii]